MFDRTGAWQWCGVQGPGDYAYGGVELHVYDVCKLRACPYWAAVLCY